MFLYDMLNNKHASLKNTVAEVNRAVKEAEEAMAALKRQADEAKSEPSFPAEDRLPADQGNAVREAEQTEELFVEPEPASGTDGAWEGAEPGSSKEKIMALYGQGKAVADIARELELGIGEVKLVIDLFQG